MNITIELQGLDAIQQQVGTMISRTSQLKPLLREISEIMMHEVQENFAKMGRNPSWPDLAKSTKRAYAKKGYLLEPTLERHSAGLLSSIDKFVTTNSAGVATNKKYAAIHNFGGPINRAARSGSVRLRTDARGNILRQNGSDHLAIFAKKSHKRAVSRDFSASGYTITMPQREFMKISPACFAEIEAAAAAFITGR
ncbi:MAG: phage virion morphogenesis protein [Desulfuromonadaceae bacterium]